MIGRDDRRVGHLRLAAPDEALIRRGTILLEDALRTASVPSLPAGRLLIVRSLALGRFAADRSPIVLSLAIEERLRGLGEGAVYAGDETASAASAVYFRDAAEPYALLARRLARGSPVDAWFWPLAAPGWRAVLPRAVAYRALLFGALQTAAGPAAALAVVRALCGDSGETPSPALDELLAPLAEEDGQRLLRAFGWATIAEPIGARPQAEERVDLPPEWRSAVAAWTERWGERDPRARWLASVALIEARVSRLSDPKAPARAWRLLTEIVADPASVDLPAGAPLEPTPVVRRTEIASVPVVVTTDRNSTGAHPRATVATAIESSAARTVDGEATAYAGFFFLVTLLERLGIAGFLDDHPDLSSVDLPNRLLHAFAARLRIPATDPVAGALPEIVEAANATVTPLSRLTWAVPEVWQAVLARGRPRLVAPGDASGRWIATDGSGRLALAAWQGEMPAAARSWCSRAVVGADGSLAALGDRDLLLAAWLRAADRWRRRYVGLGWRELVCRPGRVLATSTHVDVLMDLDAADVRIRRAGLDLDPGWVPWLGRVVTFTYA